MLTGKSARTRSPGVPRAPREKGQSLREEKMALRPGDLPDTLKQDGYCPPERLALSKRQTNNNTARCLHKTARVLPGGFCLYDVIGCASALLAAGVVCGAELGLQ